MRVLLIIPTYFYKYGHLTFLSTAGFPVGFAYLASALRSAGHEVFGLNPNNDPNYASTYEMACDKISRSLQEVQPELIGLGGLCADFKFIKDAMQIIRNLAPDVPVVCGGGIISNDAEFVFKTLRPDFCIIGEGEEILVQLVNMLESGRQDYEEISNLGYWKNKTAKFTKQDFTYIDINKRNFPDYEPFGIDEMLDKFSMAAQYLHRYTRLRPRAMTIVTARSCPFKCTFCVHERGPKYRARSIENIIQELAFLYERYRFNILLIMDELFAVNKLRLKEFCVAINNARKTQGWDFDWYFQTHASASLDREALEAAKEAGCYLFGYGLESASPKVLESMNKKTKPYQIIEAIEIAHAAKIGFGGNLIFGDIAETPQTISESMEFLLSHCLEDHMYLFNIRPYPGSKLFDNCVERGIINDRLEFYEHIDEFTFNMTSMPDILWFSWIEKLVILADSFPLAKSTVALRYTQELESVNNTMALHLGMMMWNVWSKCPYCDKEMHHRELLVDATRSPKDKNLFFRITEAYRKESKASRSFLYNQLVCFIGLSRRILKKIISFLLNFTHPIFKLLRPLIVKEERAFVSFVTGCPYCNKRIRVNIPKRLPPQTPI